MVEAIGMGAFGKVFLVDDTASGRRLALKRLERLDPGSVYRFKQEFRALADVKHPNLVRLHELHAVDDSWCFTMDYVDGVRFDNWVRGLEHDRRSSAADTTRSDESEEPEDSGERDTDDAPSSSLRQIGPLPFAEPRLRAALKQLVDGVLALHAAGILHRDLKPSNVLVTREGHVVILDFGLAATTTDLAPTSQDGRFGTPAYMSPEQARGGALTVASDWYAIGVMLYEALTGQLPFSGGAADMLAARLNRSPRDPAVIRPDLPRDLSELAMALLDRNPTARPNGFQVAQRVGLDPTVAGSPRHVLGGTFVGRSHEMQTLREAFEEARSGRTVVAHVHGPSGYGKTTLVRRFLSSLSLEREVVVLEGRCYERESVPFKALDDLVDALGRYLKTLPAVEAASLLPRDSRALVRLFPALGRLELMTSLPGRAAARDPHELRRRAFRALRDILARITDARPVVLFIDDVHWGDADSAQLIRNLLAPPDVPPMLLIAGFRGDGARSNELLRTLTSPVAVDVAWHTVDLPLGPLSDDETRELAQSLLARSDGVPEQSARIATEAGGSPLFASELARFAVTHPDDTRLVTLQALVAHRVALLPAPARELLRLVACTERPLAERVLAEASGIGLAELKPALERLRDERLIASPLDAHAAGIAMLHDKLRLAVLETLDEAEFRSCHAALAKALDRCGSEDLESIAHHYEAAGDLERAGVWLERAADRASATLAFGRAVSLYEAARSRVSAVGALGLQRKLADALVGAGRCPEAARELLLLAEQAKDAEARELRRRAAEQYLRSGHVAEGLQEFGPLLVQAGLPLPRSPGTALASLLWARAQLKLRGVGFAERAEADIPAQDLQRVDYAFVVGVGLAGIDVVVSARYHAASLLAALRAGEPKRISRSLALTGGFKVLEHMDQVPVGAEQIERACELADRTRDSYARGWTAAARAVVAFARMDLAKTVEFSDESAALFRDRSDAAFRELGTIEVWFALHALFLSGRLQEFASRAGACAREAEARGDRFTLSTVRAYDLALHWAVLDRPQDGRREADAAIADWPEGAWYHQHWAWLRAQCFLDLYEGEGARAAERVVQFHPRLKQAMHLRIRTPRLECNYLHGRGALAAMIGGPSRAEIRTVSERISDLAKERNGLADVYAGLLAAGLSAVTEPGRAERAFEEAEKRCAEHGMPLHVLACAERRARCRGDAAAIREAEERLREKGVRAPARFIDMLAPRVVATP
ncbi:MAG TPA: AAA family ATPase [Polyangiaceae bacterium]|nr:AAA family ATPase [Polyangiaceae bacterium]